MHFITLRRYGTQTLTTVSARQHVVYCSDGKYNVKCKIHSQRLHGISNKQSTDLPRLIVLSILCGSARSICSRDVAAYSAAAAAAAVDATQPHLSIKYLPGCNSCYMSCAV